MTRRWRWNESVWTRFQRVTLWTLGAAGIVNELFVVPKPRPEAWPIIGMLVGLPFAQALDQALDQARQRRDSKENEEG